MSLLKFLFLGMFAIFTLNTQSIAQETAKVQIIHNAADLAAATVDIYVNGEIALNDFEFRSATPYLDLPAGVDLVIAVQPPDSENAENPLAEFTVNLEAGKNYTVIANGIVSGEGYDPVKPFDLFVIPDTRLVSNQDDRTDVIVFHGSTDAPTVQVYESAVVNAAIIEDFSYGDIAGYLELPEEDFVLEVRDATGEVTVAAYSAPLKTIGAKGAAMTVFASGFLNPASNSNGPAFGLFAALADGTVLELPLIEDEIETAKVQIIHNAADLAAATVDIYVNGEIALNDFEFRSATPYLDLPAGVDLVIAVQPPDSENAENHLAEFTVNLEAGKNYTVIANGIVSGEGYDPVKPFNLFVIPDTRLVSNQDDRTDVIVFHGSTDAPTVQVYESAVVNAAIIEDFSYGDIAGYLELPEEDFVLEVRDATGEVTVAAYSAPLKTLGAKGAAMTVFASGFLNPASNSNGPAFGLFAALADGTVLELPLIEDEIETAKVQIIHNAADLAAATVDIYVNGEIALNDFEFRSATPYLDLPAGVDLVIAVQPPDSENAENPLAEFTVNLEAGKNYTIIANGIVSGEGYDPVKPFNLFVIPDTRLVSNQDDRTDVIVFHGSTDAPTVQVYESAVVNAAIIEDFSYGDIAGYLELPEEDFVLEIRDATGEVTVAAYSAPLKTLGAKGAAMTVFASGFLNPASNSNGPAFGLFAALADGTVLELPPATMSSVNELNTNISSMNVFPNPVSDIANIILNLNNTSNIDIDIYNIYGTKISTNNFGTMSAGEHLLPVNINGLASGVYMLKVQTGNSFYHTLINVVK